MARVVVVVGTPGTRGVVVVAVAGSVRVAVPVAIGTATPPGPRMVELFGQLDSFLPPLLRLRWDILRFVACR
jgi:hypothetical protein